MAVRSKAFFIIGISLFATAILLNLISLITLINDNYLSCEYDTMVAPCRDYIYQNSRHQGSCCDNDGYCLSKEYCAGDVFEVSGLRYIGVFFASFAIIMFITGCCKRKRERKER